MKWLRRREGRLSPHEQERLADFAAMSIRDVRARADEFAEAQEEYRQWLITPRPP